MSMSLGLVKSSSLRLFLVVFIILSLGFQLYRIRDTFFASYDYEYYSDRYLHSQYVMGEGSKYIISDFDLYAYAGYFYVTGGDISRVNFENPPLGKYLIGLSILVFNNPHIIYIGFDAWYLYLTYKFGLLLNKNQLVPLIAISVLVWDPYFIHMVKYTHLDFLMATFFITGLYLFITAKSLKHYSLSSLFFGLALATKFFPFFAIVLAYLVFFQWATRRKELLAFILSIPIIFITYTFTHVQYILSHNIVEFIKYQWWVVRWRSGNPIVVGNIIQSVLFGRLKVWWKTTEQYHSWSEEWSPLLPTVVLTSIVSSFKLNTTTPQRFIIGYITIFLLYIFFITEGGLKYLAPLYLFFYLFSAALIFSLLRNKHKTNRR